jgi:FkbM family methyltransferase
LWWLGKIVFESDTILVDTPNGLPITINPYDYGQLMLFYFHYCPELQELLHDIVHIGDICLDLGSNIGLFTAVLSEIVGENGLVIAVDANSEVISQLKKTISRFYPHQVRAEIGAIGGLDGTGYLYKPDNRYSDSVEVMVDETEELSPIKIFTIDILIDQLIPSGVPNFIKVDIEGSEIYLVQSMRNLLENGFLPNLLIEFHPNKCLQRGKDANSIRKNLLDYGYNEYRIKSIGTTYKLFRDESPLLTRENILFLP